MNEKMYTPIERLEFIIEEQDLSYNKLGTEIGLNRAQALYDIKSGKTKEISQEIAEKIIQRYPQYSIYWIRVGVGSPYDSHNENIHTPIERLEFISREEGITLNRLSKEIGLPRPQVFYEIRSGKIKDISGDLAEKIIKRYPKYNLAWVLTGKDTPYNSNHLYNSMDTLKERLDSFLSYKQLSQAKFAEKAGLSVGFVNNVGNGISTRSLNKITKAFPELNPLWLTDGEGNMINSKEEIQKDITSTLLLPVSAQGGSLNDFIVSVKDTDCETIISPIKDVDFAIPIAGDSMAPEYPSGSQVLIKKINERAFIDWGKVFVLDTCNGIVIKRVFPSEKGEGIVKCVSINPDYPPFEVSLQDVYGMYRVLMCMSLK